jgi:FAD synthetase
MKKVIVFGTFDGLHPGHLSYFKQAQKYGDYLIAVVALDKNVLKFKGHRPKFSQTERLRGLKNCPLADEARLGGQRRFDVIAKLKPDIICLGYDQEADIKLLRAKFPKITIVRLKPYKQNIYKSSILNNDGERGTRDEKMK